MAIEAAPICKLQIKCYTTLNDGKRQYNDPITEDLIFSDWVDRSPSAKSIGYLEIFHCTRLNINETIDMAPLVRQRYQQQKEAFISKYKGEEDNYEYEFIQDVPFTDEHTLVYHKQLCAKPWYANYYLMTALDIFVLGWIQRGILDSNTYSVNYKIIKYLC